MKTDKKPLANVPKLKSGFTFSLLTAHFSLKKAEAFLQDLFSEEEDPLEPIYDPVHLGASILITLFAFGALYWLLWTLLVYEGGIFLKFKGLYLWLLKGVSLRDLGYEGYPYQMGLFEGWIGNAIALILSLALIASLWKLYHQRKPR